MMDTDSAVGGPARKKKIVTTMLRIEQIERLRLLSAATDVPMAQIIRQAVDMLLEQQA